MPPSKRRTTGTRWPPFWFNAAATYQRGKDLGAAHLAYTRLLADLDTGKAQLEDAGPWRSRRKQIRRFIKQLGKVLHRTHGLVQVQIDPDGASMRVGDTPPASAGSRWLRAGAHTIVVEHPDWVAAEHHIEVTAGATQTLSVKLSTPRPVILRITSRPTGADARVDGRLVGRTPLDMQASPGPVQVTLTKDGWLSQTRTATLSRGKPATLEMELVAAVEVAVPVVAPKPSVVETWWFWTVIGTVVAAGVTTGVVLGTLPQDAPKASFQESIQLP